MTWSSFEDLIRTCEVGSKGEEEEQKWSFERIEAEEKKRSKVEKEMKNLRKVLRKMEGRRRRRG